MNNSSSFGALNRFQTVVMRHLHKGDTNYSYSVQWAYSPPKVSIFCLRPVFLSLQLKLQLV
jgi:hypothetical protein